ncbi:hypothetical protein [Aquibacillus sediminis]|uniref:hypothetical protein n=1 Tax=Aquibacillus sediminis TaxID=2574734 RepID=UPI001108CEC6|nr:hypothetical protein [Aquibacillus sediminis]
MELRQFLIGLLLVFVMMGCNNMSEKENLNDVISPHADFYMLYAVAGEDKKFGGFQEVQDYYDVDFNELLSDKSLSTLYYGSYLWSYPGENDDYVKTLDFDEFPVFVVFDSEQFVFKSSDIEEVEEFLSTREETEGIKQRRIKMEEKQIF